jgi:hypothetical protein
MSRVPSEKDSLLPTTVKSKASEALKEIEAEVQEQDVKVSK